MDGDGDLVGGGLGVTERLAPEDAGTGRPTVPRDPALPGTFRSPCR